MAKAQRKEAAQSDLFGAAEPELKEYVPKPEHVRLPLREMLERLQAETEWPWDSFDVNRMRTQTWPYYFRKIALSVNQAEADEWRSKFEAEAARLDRAGPPRDPE